MGKPYSEELAGLADTFAWAMAAPVDNLARAVRAASPHSLVAVGSGGSYTTAHFAAAAHRQFTSGIAAAMTPLEAVGTPQSLRPSAVFLLTAGGKNPDVLGAFRRLVAREPRRLLVLCASTASPLARLAAEYPYVDLAEFDAPSGKDGFLATNSLLASAVLLVRGYAAAHAGPPPLPATFQSLLGEELGPYPVEELDRQCQPLWGRKTLVVLHGPETHAAAVDLESKFSEAALGDVQLSDFRNFAHGRHHWLAKRGAETGVLAILTEEDRQLGEGLLALLPADVPVVRLAALGRDTVAAVAALAQVFMVAGSAGRARGIDPGDPGVPPFGRKIYHMRAFGPDEEGNHTRPLAVVAAVERKSGASVATLESRGLLGEWHAAYRHFVGQLNAATFRGIILDYDGTLCDEAHRFDPLPAVVGRKLNRVLRAGAVIGIATGRGKSVKQALRDALDERLWGRVVVGYYNGGDIGLLGDDSRPDGTEAVGEALQTIADLLCNHSRLSQLAKLTFRWPQITLEPLPDAHGEEVWALLQHVLYTLGSPGVAALRSSHSMDVVAPGVCKRAVLERVRHLLGAPEEPVLCIGDRGRWPGNDFSLLSGPYSLSVDEVSPDPLTCWNLAAPGQRGAQATLDYLERLQPGESGFQLSFD